MVNIIQNLSYLELGLHSFITKSILNLKLKRLVSIRFSKETINAVTHLTYDFKLAREMIFTLYLWHMEYFIFLLLLIGTFVIIIYIYLKR